MIKPQHENLATERFDNLWGVLNNLQHSIGDAQQLDDLCYLIFEDPDFKQDHKASLQKAAYEKNIANEKLVDETFNLLADLRMEYFRLIARLNPENEKSEIADRPKLRMPFLEQRISKMEARYSKMETRYKKLIGKLNPKASN